MSLYYHKFTPCLISSSFQQTLDLLFGSILPGGVRLGGLILAAGISKFLVELVKGLYDKAVHNHKRGGTLTLEHEEQCIMCIAFCVHRVANDHHKVELNICAYLLPHCSMVQQT